MFFPSVLLVAHNVTEEGAWKKLSMLIVRGLKIVYLFNVPQRDITSVATHAKSGPSNSEPWIQYSKVRLSARDQQFIYPPLWDENTTRRDTSVSGVKTIN